MSVRYAPVRGFRTRALVLVLPILVISGMLAGTSFPLSEAQGSINVWTDKTSYHAYDLVTVSGHVNPVIPDESVLIQVFNPRGGYTFDLVMPNNDGSWSSQFRVGTESDIIGTYTVKAIYSGESAETTFELLDTVVYRTSTAMITTRGKTYPLEYGTFRVAAVPALLNYEFTSLVIFVRAQQDGLLKLSLPRDLIDSTYEDGSSAFFSFFIDGEHRGQFGFDPSKTKRTVEIPIPAGSKKLEIYGTKLTDRTRPNYAYMHLYGVWNRDPITYYVIADSQHSEKYIDIVHRAFFGWTFILREYSGNQQAWNFLLSDDAARADITVHLRANWERCKSAGGDAAVWEVGDLNQLKPIQINVATSCNDQQKADDDVLATAMHEIAHAMGLGHAWNIDGDFMCSVDIDPSNSDKTREQKDTCDYRDKVTLPTQTNVNALFFLYGTDGFAEPNHTLPVPDEYRSGMIGVYAAPIPKIPEPKFDHDLTVDVSREIVTIYGRVQPTEEGTKAGIHIFDPHAVEYTYLQRMPSWDGYYSAEIKIEGGISGTYWVRASYGGESIVTNFKFTAPQPKPPTPPTTPTPKDTDGDGIQDSVDQCKTEPETFNGYQDRDGCPDTVPPVPTVSTPPEIVFDKEGYTPFDKVVVDIIYSDGNLDPRRIDTVRPIISSSVDGTNKHTFVETGINTGIFEAEFTLTPSRSVFLGDLVVTRGDTVTVQFNSAMRSASVDYHVGRVFFNNDTFKIGQTAVVMVIDPDANRNPYSIDTLNVWVWSRTDTYGLMLTLRETGDRTGIFEEIITFTPDEESSGTRLRVNEGDTVTAKYTDNTLPAPARLDADGVFTIESEELFASALIGYIENIWKLQTSQPAVIHSGQRTTSLSVSSYVIINVDVSNMQQVDQKFTVLFQVKDSEGMVVDLREFRGEVSYGEGWDVTTIDNQLWVPSEKGMYKIEVFTWNSINNPVPLAPSTSLSVIVK